MDIYTFLDNQLTSSYDELESPLPRTLYSLPEPTSLHEIVVEHDSENIILESINANSNFSSRYSFIDLPDEHNQENSTTVIREIYNMYSPRARISDSHEQIITSEDCDEIKYDTTRMDQEDKHVQDVRVECRSKVKIPVAASVDDQIAQNDQTPSLIVFGKGIVLKRSSEVLKSTNEQTESKSVDEPPPAYNKIKSSVSESRYVYKQKRDSTNRVRPLTTPSSRYTRDRSTMTSEQGIKIKPISSLDTLKRFTYPKDISPNKPKMLYQVQCSNIESPTTISERLTQVEDTVESLVKEVRILSRTISPRMSKDKYTFASVKPTSSSQIIAVSREWDKGCEHVTRKENTKDWWARLMRLKEEAERVGFTSRKNNLPLQSS